MVSGITNHRTTKARIKLQVEKVTYSICIIHFGGKAKKCSHELQHFILMGYEHIYIMAKALFVNSNPFLID